MFCRALSALISSVTHKNPYSKAKVAQYLDVCVARVGQRLANGRELDRLITALANLLSMSDRIG